MSDAPTPQQGFVALMIRTARELGMECVAPMRQVLLRMDGEMFGGDELAVYQAIVELIERGAPPGPGELMAHDPEDITAEVIGRLHRIEKMYGSFGGAADAVIAHHESTRLLQKAVEAQAAIRRGELSLARTLMAEGSSEAPSRGLQEDGGFETFAFNPKAEKRASVGMARLDRLLGGGLGFSGRHVMSLWVMATGVGKSTFMQGVVAPALLRQGHWVYYFTGEADGDEVKTEIARMQADVSYEMMEYVRTTPNPAIMEKMEAGISNLREMPGRFMAHDEAFSDSTVRLLAAARKSELEQAKREGRAHPEAELVVIVDNLDHAIEALESRHREDQVYNQSARRFVLSARQHGYHLAVLHQTNAEGEKRNGPPHKTDVAFAKAIVNHTGVMVTGHRPITPEDRAAVEADGSPGRRARHLLASRKARGGKVDEIEVSSNPNTGLWFDPEHTEAPF